MLIGRCLRFSRRLSYGALEEEERGLRETKDAARNAEFPRRRCRHLHPMLVTAVEGFRRARCLGCDDLGPPCPSLSEAMRMLRDPGQAL